MKNQINQMPVWKGARLALRGVKNMILRSTGESLRPIWLVFMPTDRCNSRCQHCDIWQKEPAKDPLTPEEVETALRSPLFRDIKLILNTGGEPSLRDDLEEIILAEHRALPDAQIQLSTNGLLPKRVIDIVQLALEHDINVELGTSIDGIGDKHDFVRGVPGNFEKVDYLLHQLVLLREQYKGKLSIGTQMTISDLNIDSVEEVRDYTRKMKVRLLEGWYNEAPFYDNIGKNVASQKLTAVIQSQKNSPMRQKWLRQIRGDSIRFPCFAMYTFCVLKCNGDIVPCLNLWDIKVGNIRESTSEEIWHSPEARDARKLIKQCSGCLNSWGYGWSSLSNPLGVLPFYLKRPRELYEKLREK